MDKLKAACLALAQEALKPPNLFDPNSKFVTAKLEDVLESLQGVETQLTPTVAEYVFFPLRGLLQQDSLGSRQTELLFNIVTFLCRFAWSNGGLDVARAQQLVAVTTYLLSPDPPISGTVKGMSMRKPTAFFAKPASFRAAGFNCITGLFTVAAAAGYASELTKSPTTAQLITLDLEGLEHDQDEFEAQIAYLAALSTILGLLNAENLALVLPGVVSKLTKFVHPSARRHFRAKIRAIACLQLVIVNTIGDGSWAESTATDSPLQRVVRTSSWLESTVEKLGDSFVALKQLQTSLIEVAGSRIELLNAIYTFATTVYIECYTKLDNTPAIEPLVQLIMITSSQNLDMSLANRASQFIQSTPSLNSRAESGFIEYVRQIPSAVTSANESRALTTLRLVKGMVDIIGSSGTIPLANAEALIDSMVLPVSVTKRGNTVADLPTTASAVRTLEPYHKPRSTTTSEQLLSLNDLGLDLPVTRATQQSLASILAEVGRLGSDSVLELLVDRLQSLKLRSPRSLDGVSLLWVSACVVSGLPRGTDVYDIVTFCYDDLAEALNIQDSVARGTVTTQAHTALACYVIGEAALIQGEEFREFLVDLIHPLFSMIGHAQSSVIREQAGLAFAKVAYACGFSTPTELALDTKDYLVDGISLQLNTLNFTPSTPQALATLVYLSGTDIVPYLDDVFASLFVILDHYHGYSRLVTGILTVFRALIFVVDKSLNGVKLLDDKPADTIIKNKIEISTFEELLAELQRKPEVDPSILENPVDLDKLASENQMEEENLKNSNDENSEESDEEQEPPLDEPEEAIEKWEYPVAKPVYTILLRIAGYCDRLMTHESADIRVATLELVTLLIPFLAVNKEEFLPLVHKTWPEAIERVFDDEVYVVEQSFRCLSAISQYAQGFVAARLQTLWPRLLQKYGPLLRKSWPQFAPERRVLNSFTELVITVIAYVPDLTLAVMEPTVVAYRPALLRGEFAKLKDQVELSRPSFRDLLWLVLLDSPVVPTDNRLHTVNPVYKSN